MNYNDILDDVIEEMNASELGRELYEKGKDLLLPFLKNLAKAKYHLEVKEEKEAAIIIQGMERAIQDISAALAVHFSNKVKETIEGLLRSIISKFIF